MQYNLFKNAQSWRIPGGKHRGNRPKDLTEGELYGVWSWHHQNRPGNETDVELGKELKWRGLPVEVPGWVGGWQGKSSFPESVQATAEKIEIQDECVICPVCGRDKRRERELKKDCCGWVTLESDPIGAAESEIPVSDECPF